MTTTYAKLAAKLSRSLFAGAECRLAVGAWLLGLAACASAQQNYGAYFQQNARKYSGQMNTETAGRYLYDKYFYNKPSVSPYLNLDRVDPYGGTSYQAYVRPQEQRRKATMMAQSQYIDQRKRQGNVGHTAFPGATYGQAGTAILKPVPQSKSTPSAYYNHWYGGWSGR